jgi:hypothetical protein
MNSVSGILSREYITKSDSINILWTNVDNILFEDKIKKLKHKLITMDQLYFGKEIPQLIVCNNKILYHQTCKNISIQFHIPVLLIDHLKQPSTMTSDKESSIIRYDLPCSINVAMSKEIAESWEKSTRYDYVLESKDYDQAMWSDIIFKTSKRIFKYYG